MDDQEQLISSLCAWFNTAFKNIHHTPTVDQCELLLCARDLKIKNSRALSVLKNLAEINIDLDLPKKPLLLILKTQLVLAKYDVAQGICKEFLEHWFYKKNYRGKDIVTVGYLVIIGLEQLELLDLASREYVKNWFLRHKDIRSDTLRVWAPYCLRIAGHIEEGKKRAVSEMMQREKNGSWGYDLQRTLNCAYALKMSKFVENRELDSTITYILGRLRRGLSDEISNKAKALKLFYALGMLPESIVDNLRKNINKDSSIFLSYNHEDKDFVRKLAKELKVFGIRVWFDEAEILPGDSFFGKIEEGIDEMHYLGVVLSPRSVNSAWVKKELRMAQIAELKNRDVKVVPIMLEDCEVPLSLQDICWADFRTDFNDGLNQLLNRILH